MRFTSSNNSFAPVAGQIPRGQHVRRDERQKMKPYTTVAVLALALGRQVRTLLARRQNAGYHTMV
jgi:hypothetical protein